MTVHRYIRPLLATSLLAATWSIAAPVAAVDAITVNIGDYNVIGAQGFTSRYKSELESIGVGRQLFDSGLQPLEVYVLKPTRLTFRVLASLPQLRDPTIRARMFEVDDVVYSVPEQAFDPAGTVLGTQLFAGFFETSLRFGIDPDDPTSTQPFGLANQDVLLFIRSSDTVKIEGEDSFIGEFDRLYFEAYDSLFEVSVASVPEPSAWALMVAGFGLVGAAVRRRRPASA